MDTSGDVQEQEKDRQEKIESALERTAQFRYAVWAVALALVLLYAAPVSMYYAVGVDRGDAWASRLTLAKPQPGSFFECPKEVAKAPAQSQAARTPQLGAVVVNAAAPPLIAKSGCRALTVAERTFLDAAEEWLVAVGNFHLEVARDLFKWQFLATLSGLVAGALTAASVLVIALQGFPTAHLWMKAVFVVCSASAAFWVATPQVYRYSANQIAALKGYSLAIGTLWQLRASRAGSLDGDGKWLDGGRFISGLPAKLSEIGALSLSFDESKMNIPDLKVPGAGG